MLRLPDSFDDHCLAALEVQGLVVQLPPDVSVIERYDQFPARGFSDIGNRCHDLVNLFDGKRCLDNPFGFSVVCPEQRLRVRNSVGLAQVLRIHELVVTIHALLDFPDLPVAKRPPGFPLEAWSSGIRHLRN